MKYACAKDVNHGPLTALLRTIRAPYKDTSTYLGLGCDIIGVHVDGYPMLVEFKKPGPPHCRKLTDSEAALQSLFPNFYRVVQSDEELLRALGRMR